MRCLFSSIIRTAIPKHVCSLLITVAVFCSYSVYGRTELSGSIGGKSLSAEDGPYIVIEDVEIPEGESTTIGEGCQFFFVPFTGILVNGTLIVNGTQNQPVVFSSINDSLSPDRKELLPNPFDWNGIRVTPKAENVSLKHFILSYSVYGIKSQSKPLIIDNGTFWQNGQFHFTMMDKPMPVNDGIPYSYQGASVSRPPKHSTSGGGSTNRTRSVFVKKGVPALIGAAGAGSGIVSLIYTGKWFDLRDEFRIETNPNRRENIEDDGKRSSQIAAGTGAFSITAITTSAVLLWWWNFREENSAQVLPLIVPGGGGVTVSVNIK